MLEAGVFTIIWFIVKVIIALALVFYGSLFIYGLLRLMVERSNGSILKMILKVILLIIVGGVLAYYLGEAVNHFFGEGRTPTGGGIAGLFLLVILALSKLVGNVYMSASIFALIIWLVTIYYLIKMMFEKPKPLSEEVKDINRRIKKVLKEQEQNKGVKK